MDGVGLHYPQLLIPDSWFTPARLNSPSQRNPAEANYSGNTTSSQSRHATTTPHRRGPPDKVLLCILGNDYQIEWHHTVRPPSITSLAHLLILTSRIPVAAPKLRVCCSCCTQFQIPVQYVASTATRSQNNKGQCDEWTVTTGCQEPAGGGKHHGF